MENFYLSDAEPETYPTPDRKLVDEFGQWKNHSWPGKITSLDELRKTMDQNLGPAAYPFPSWNRWGGDSNRKLKNGTGFFSTFKTRASICQSCWENITAARWTAVFLPLV